MTKMRPRLADIHQTVDVVRRLRSLSAAAMRIPILYRSNQPTGWKKATIGPYTIIQTRSGGYSIERETSLSELRVHLLVIHIRVCVNGERIGTFNTWAKAIRYVRRELRNQASARDAEATRGMDQAG
jgi:hypothetical protein